MDAEPPHSSELARGLEDSLAALDTYLSDAEKQAAALLKAARRLRRTARESNVASLLAAIAAARADASGAELDALAAAAFGKSRFVWHRPSSLYPVEPLTDAEREFPD